MIFDGKRRASEILARTEDRAASLARPPLLAIVVANETPATRSYLSIKQKNAQRAGCRLEIVRLPESASTLEMRLAIEAVSADAVVVQLPVPEHASPEDVCDAIPPEKDADVLGARSRMRFEAAEAGALLPPVAGALADILWASGISPKGRRAVVLGDGWLVGKPCATWLAHTGADVRHTSDLAELRLADIVVSGLGAPHVITPDLLKEGCVFMDAGTSELATPAGGRIVGDADPACAEKCALFTPVPGGVGPIAVAKLFENAVMLAERGLTE